MGKVYSFRLDDDNPREAQAKGVINARVGEGYSLRHVVVEALVLFSERSNNPANLDTLIEFLENQFSKIELNQIKPNDAMRKPQLSTSILESVKKSAKLGLTSK